MDNLTSTGQLEKGAVVVRFPRGGEPATLAGEYEILEQMVEKIEEDVYHQASYGRTTKSTKIVSQLLKR